MTGKQEISQAVKYAAHAEHIPVSGQAPLDGIREQTANSSLNYPAFFIGLIIDLTRQ